MLKVNFSRKQLFLYNIIKNEDDIIGITAGGGAGGGKTGGLCVIAIALAVEFPRLKVGVFRKTASSLTHSTRDTMMILLAKSDLIRDRDWELKDQGSTILFKNGSRIIFSNLDPAGDPTFARIGSTTYDFAFVDEAGEISELAYSTLRSRIGRGDWSLENKKPGKIVMSCNPSTNFLRKQFYDKYEKRENQKDFFVKWKHGKTYINDKKVDAYDAFLRMTCYDNPWLSDSYIENLKSLPKLQRKRLFEGDWNFMDSDNSICSYSDIERATVFKVPEPKYEEKETGAFTYKRGKPEKEIVKNEVFTRVAGIDVAASGGDTTCLTIIDQGVVLCCEKLEVDKSAQDVSRQYWLAAKNLLKKFGFEAQYARRIVVEKNGVGLGLLTAAQTDGWMCSGQTMTGQVRSQNYYDMGLKIQRGELMFLDGFDNFEQLKDELVAHTVSFNLQEPRVVPKEKVKEALGGKSPDFADSLFWAYYAFSNSKINAEIGRTRFRIANI